MKTETLYRKRGRRYYPVAEQCPANAFADGAWLVVCKPGVQTTRRLVSPAHAFVEAGIETASDAMVEAMREAMRPRAVRRGQTDLERRAFAAYQNIVGKDHPLILEGASLAQIVKAGLDAVREAMAAGKEKQT